MDAAEITIKIQPIVFWRLIIRSTDPEPRSVEFPLP
jgi:hypothetical protein